MPSPVVLINMFEVPAGMENEFVGWWKGCSEALKKEPGFMNATLHQNLKPGSRFQFINVAHWETAELLDLARAKNKDALQPMQAWKGNPAIYEVASQY